MLSELLIVSVLSMGAIGAVLSVFLAFADKRLKVGEDPRLDALVELLPNSNCGGCGYPGCRMLAEKLLSGEAPPNACVAGGNKTATSLARFLGVAVMERKRVLAVVLCKGGNAEAKKDAVYRGEKTCAAANLTGGEKSCSYSCLGYGDCVRACKYGAMDMDGNGLPAVFYDKCIGCGACARACPRNIIEMHPEDHTLFVYCRNRDKGARARKVCSVSCIACGLCVKDCSVPGGIEIRDNLARVDYSLAPQNPESTGRCPTKCIINGAEAGSTKDAFYANGRNGAA